MQLGVKPSDIKFVAVSHTHPDHIGNVTMFPQSTLLVQKAEYDWPAPVGAALQAGAAGEQARRAITTCSATAAWYDHRDARTYARATRACW